MTPIAQCAKVASGIEALFGTGYYVMDLQVLAGIAASASPSITGENCLAQLLVSFTRQSDSFGLLEQGPSVSGGVGILVGLDVAGIWTDPVATGGVCPWWDVWVAETLRERYQRN